MNIYRSFLFGIKINDIEDENEYIISIPKDNGYNIELYDFKNKHSYDIMGINGYFYSKIQDPLFLLIKMSFQKTFNL